MLVFVLILMSLAFIAGAFCEANNGIAKRIKDSLKK